MSNTNVVRTAIVPPPLLRAERTLLSSAGKFCCGRSMTGAAMLAAMFCGGAGCLAWGLAFRLAWGMHLVRRWGHKKAATCEGCGSVRGC